MSRKSKELIVNTMLELMQTSEFQEITVSEICAWSNVARRTFYNNFDSKEEVIKLACVNIIKDSITIPESISNYKIEEFSLTLLTSFFHTNQQNNDFIQLLFKQNLYHFYVSTLHHASTTSLKAFLNKHVEHLSPVIDRYALHAYTSMVLQIYEQWAYHNFIETAEEIARIALDMVMSRGQFTFNTSFFDK